MNGLELLSGYNLNQRQKDVFVQQVLKMAGSVSGNGHLGTGMTRTAGSTPLLPTIPPQKLEQAMDQILSGPNGFRRLAYSMQLPLKTRLDYVSVDRKVLLVDEMPQGDFPIYDVDIPEFGAVKLSFLGSPVTFETNVRRVQFPTFVLGIDEVVKYEDIQIRRYPIFDRAKERVAIAMAIAEDDEFFRVLTAAAAVSPNTPLTASSVTKIVLADGVGGIIQNQLIAAKVIMNPVQYVDLLKFSSNDVDQVTLNTVVETGFFGTIFGMGLIVSTRCPVGHVYVVTTPDKLGRLPERKKVEVKIFDNVPQGQYDIYGWEQIGMGIHNPAGVQEIVIS
jgi:hypothetical protein